MLTEQVEVYLRIVVPQVHHAFERHIRMAVTDGAMTSVQFRGYITLHVQIVVSISVVCQLAYMRRHICLACSMVNLSFRCYI